MRIDVITLFPEMVEHAVAFGIVARARSNNLWSLTTWNPRDFVHDPHRTVDDRPFGGGPGMVMLAKPLHDALAATRTAQREADCPESHVICLSPSGVPLTHARVMELAKIAQTGTALTLLAGRYEGIDERLLAREVDEQISIGDFVVSGGELPALMLIDALVRQLPGALNDQASSEEESFVDGLIDYPHYTRPPIWDGEPVPEVLLSGHHAEIARWRLAQALLRTEQRRPDLLAKRGVSAAERRLMDEFRDESDSVS